MTVGVRLAVAALVAGAIGGCASRQIHGDDGSVSFGPSNAGALVEPAELPASGEGFWIPPIWRQRGLRYGTDELIALIREVGRAVQVGDRTRAIAVADLSTARGGPSAWHRSHQTGRDVDLLFFARDAAGAPIPSDVMRRYAADGSSVPGVGPDGRPLA